MLVSFFFNFVFVLMQLSLFLSLCWVVLLMFLLIYFIFLSSLGKLTLIHNPFVVIHTMAAGLNPNQLKVLQQMFAGQSTKDPGLVSFRAGRLHMDETTNMVTADKKRGKIKLLKDEQGLLKFQWWNRISNQKELDLTVFPSSAKWERINECTDGRVYILRMTGSNMKHFFWMQEPKEDKDEEYFTNINKLCNGESIGDAKDAKETSSSTSASSGLVCLFCMHPCTD